MKLQNAVRTMMLVASASSAAMAQIEIPAGTKVSARLEQTLSSATAEEGQPVQLSVVEAVMVDGVAAIPQGATVQGTIVQAQGKRRMGRTGKLDFSIDKVRAADGQFVPLRYTMHKKEGGSHSVRTGVITAGVAVAFWPAAPFMLLMKGKDVTLNRGMVLDVFTDQSHVLTKLPGQPAQVSGMPAAPRAMGAMGTMVPVTITSDVNGAEVEIDGGFVGSAPSTRKLAPGTHRITVRSGARVWERTLMIQDSEPVTVQANLGADPADLRRSAARR